MTVPFAIADHALDLILCDPDCATYIDDRAEQILGRLKPDDLALPSDDAWWSAINMAVGEIIDAARALNRPLYRAAS